MPGPANSLNITEAGYVTFDGTSVFHGRTFQAGTGITLTNASGVAGNTTIASTATLTDLHVAKWIVNATSNAGGNNATIQSAINSAVAGETVFIYPGTYTENLQLKNGVNLTSFSGEGERGQVTIVGKMSTGSTMGVTLSGIRFNTNGDNILSLTNGAQISFIDCYFLITGNVIGFSDTTNTTTGQLILDYCSGDISSTNSQFIVKSGSGQVLINFCMFSNGTFNSQNSTLPSTISAGKLNMSNNIFPLAITSSGTASVTDNKSTYSFDSSKVSTNLEYLILGGSGSNIIEGCYFDSGTATSVTISSASTLTNSTFKSSNTNVIDGASTLSYSGLNFTGTSSKISTTTQIPLVSSNDAIKITTPGAYPYTTIPQDALILVDTSAARTIIPLASPTTGQKHIIKDSVGSAPANNITITPSGKNIDGAASSTINIAYGSVTIVFGGTEWHIV